MSDTRVVLEVEESGARRLLLDGATAGIVDADTVRRRAPGTIPHLGPDLDAATSAVRRRAAAAIAACTTRDIEVVGNGVLAAAVRTTVGDGRGPGRPAAVVDTTGDRDLIVAALRRVSPGGTVVLAAWPPHPPLVVDPYTDLHRTGVALRCPAVHDGAGEIPVPRPPAPVAVRSGAPVPFGLWYLVTGGG